MNPDPRAVKGEDITVSIRLAIRPGVHELVCAKCGHHEGIRVAAADGGRWSIIRGVQDRRDANS